MAQQKTYDIRCPKCGATQQAELYDAIDVAKEPALREALMTNQLNAVTCADCGFQFRVDKPLLYNDPDRQVMIYLIPAELSARAEAERQVLEMVRGMSEALPANVQPPELYLVLNRIELVELIFLLEAGLNVRVIEYIKYLIYSRNPERLNPEAKVILFNAQDSTDEQLCFVVQDVKTRQLEAMFQFARADYDALLEAFDRDEQTPSLLELFSGPYINARAALLGREPSDGPADSGDNTELA